MKVQKTCFTTFCHTQIHLALSTEKFCPAATTIHLAPVCGRLFTGQWPILSKWTDAGTFDAFSDCTFFAEMIFSLSLSLFSPKSKLLQISVRESSKESVPPSWCNMRNELTAANENKWKAIWRYYFVVCIFVQ